MITTTDSYSETSTEKIIPLDVGTYNSFMETNNTYTLPSGLTCSVRATKRSVTLYDYEYDLNESRREIKLMDRNYVNQMEEQFKTVMDS